MSRGFNMARPNPLLKMMQEPLPSITFQKRKLYRPDIDEVNYIYNKVNKYVFNNELARPPITLGHYKGFWGECTGHDEFTNRGTYCTIKISKSWFCLQWLVTTIAHEMAHQYEWDILGDWHEHNGQDRRMTHRQAFFTHKAIMAKYGISLKTAHSQRKWFKYQDFSKC